MYFFLVENRMSLFYITFHQNSIESQDKVGERQCKSLFTFVYVLWESGYWCNAGTTQSPESSHLFSYLLPKQPNPFNYWPERIMWFNIWDWWGIAELEEVVIRIWKLKVYEAFILCIKHLFGYVLKVTTINFLWVLLFFYVKDKVTFPYIKLFNVMVA